MNIFHTAAAKAQLSESINQAISSIPNCDSPASSLCPSVSCACGGQCVSDLTNCILGIIDHLYLLFETEQARLKQRATPEDFERHVASHRDLADIVHSASRHLLLPHGYRLAINELNRFKQSFGEHVSSFDVEP